MKELIEKMAEAILNSWNFCGDQKEAARQIFNDFNVKWDNEIYYKAIEKADSLWNKL